MAAIDVDSIVTSLDKIDAQSLSHDAGASGRLMEAARKIIARLELPFMQIFYTTQFPASLYASLKIVSDIGIWQTWREAGGKEATLVELWDTCSIPCDINLLRRLLRLVTAGDILVEVGEDRWRPTPTSLALGNKDSSAYNCMIANETQVIPSVLNFPNFLARTNYQDPVDPLHSNYMDLTPERLNFFQRMSTDAQMNKSFSGFMSGYAEARLDWTQLYDFNELLHGFGFEDASHKLLVDVGGSHGVDLLRVIERKPDIPAGYLVLQDLPDVVANAKLSEKIELMPYDFFTEQPIVGSRAYLLRAVLHDWDDIDARRILRRVGAAMKKDYSKLLICDVALPPVGAKRYQAISDFSMMHLCSSSDRTEKQWVNLLHSADFEVARVWRHPDSSDTLFEAVLAGSRSEESNDV